MWLRNHLLPESYPIDSLANEYAPIFKETTGFPASWLIARIRLVQRICSNQRSTQCAAFASLPTRYRMEESFVNRND